MQVKDLATVAGTPVRTVRYYHPVSYTHLDVYKRQVCRNIGLALESGIQCDRGPDP